MVLFITYPLILLRYWSEGRLCLLVCFCLKLRIVSWRQSFQFPFLICLYYVLSKSKTFNLLCDYSLCPHLCKLQSKHWQIIASYLDPFYPIQFPKLLDQMIPFVHALMLNLNYDVFVFDSFFSFWRSFESTHLIPQAKICNILHLDLRKILLWLHHLHPYIVFLIIPGEVFNSQIVLMYSFLSNFLCFILSLLFSCSSASFRLHCLMGT